MNLCVSELLNIRSKDKAKQIKDALLYWQSSDGSWRKIIPNLCSDPHLPSKARSDLMGVIGNNVSDEPALHKEYENTCRRHQLKGKVFKNLPADRILWNAISEDRLRKWLETKYDVNDVDWIIDRLVTDFEKITTHRSSKKEYIRPYNMWGTWKEKTGGYPFETWYGADHVRSRLGLSELERNQPLFVIGYELPEGYETRTPTVADAGCFPYFKPNLQGAPGITDPWLPKNDLKDSKGNLFCAAPCPEVIHPPVMFNQIRKVKCLNP